MTNILQLVLGKVDPVLGKDPDIQLVLGKVPRDPVLGKDPEIQLVLGKVLKDPTGAGKSMTRAIFWSYRVNLLRLWEVENCFNIVSHCGCHATVIVTS